jgi:hypothetical protein
MSFVALKIMDAVSNQKGAVFQRGKPRIKGAVGGETVAKVSAPPTTKQPPASSCLTKAA